MKVRLTSTHRLHEKFGVAAATAVTDVAAVRARLDLAAAELLPGEVAAHPPGAPGGARHGGGEVDRLLHVRTVRPQPEVFRVDGVLGSRSEDIFIINYNIINMTILIY